MFISTRMNLILISVFSFIFLRCSAGPMEDISSMPDLTLFYQQLLRLPDLQRILQDITQSQQAGLAGDFTIFAPSNDAMTRSNQRNEDPNILWRYHIVPGRYDDLTIYKLAQEKFTLSSPRNMGAVRPQNNLRTLAAPFQLFYGSGFYNGVGPYINVSYETNNYEKNILPWAMQTSLNQTNQFDNSIPLNPHMANLNNYNPNQNSQSYVVAQGSASSGNPNMFPANLTNYYTNVFNPNVNTQFLQNANPPSSNLNPVYQHQQLVNRLSYASVGILRPTINNAIVLQTRLMSRGVINIIDDILWPPERRDPTAYKTAYDALEGAQFSRLRLLAQRSEYFRSELTSQNHQTFFLPNDEAFASFGSGLSFLFDQTTAENNDYINDFIRSHIIPIVMFPSAMDASKQISTLSLGKWVTFRKLVPSPAVSVDVVSNRQAARILTTRSPDVQFYGNGVVYTIPVILSGPTRSAADQLAESYQYFMSLIQQSGDTELVNILQGSTAGLGNTGPNIFNPQNLLNITVLIPQQMSVQQLGNSQGLSQNLRRHILRFPVYTDQIFAYQSQPPFIQQGVGIPPFQRSRPGTTKNRRRRQVNIPIPNQNLPYQQQPQQIPPFQQQQIPPFQQQPQQQQQIPPFQQQPQQQQQIPPFQQQPQQQQQIAPFQQQPQPQQLNPALNPSYYQMPNFPTSAIFQDGQFYPTMDPEFSVQAQVSSSPLGNVVTLIGRPGNSAPFTATILNTESNLPVKNGVMHVIRGLISGSVIPIDTVLSTMQGASSFTQLLQQTGVVDMLKQSGRTYTLFIPTNTALQSIGVTNDMNRIRQFVLRHICADVLLDPMASMVRRSGGYYNRKPMSPVPPPQRQQQQQQQRRSRRKRQAWTSAWNNASNTVGGQYIKPPDLGPGYFQPNQQVYGGYPAAPSPFSFYNQLYNPGYVMSGYANPNSEYYPGYNGSYLGDSFDYANLGVPSQYPAALPYSPQITVIPIMPIESPNYLLGAGGFLSGSAYAAVPQSCMSMTGERITVQPLAGGQPGGINQPMYYQNLMVTCCGDQSVNAMVQSYNIYPPSFAVYLIGRTLLGQGQTISTMYNHTTHLQSSLLIFIFLFFLIIKKSF